VIYAFADLLGLRLVALGLAATVVGAWLAATGDASAQGLGAALLVLGLGEAAAGAPVRLAAERRRRRTIGQAAARARDAAAVRRVLLASAVAAVLLVSGACWLGAMSADPWARGAALGVILQGSLLLVLAVVHLRWLPAPGPLLPDGIRVFPGPGHDPFRLSPAAPATRPEQGALLVHQFGGSPREMRALAAVLASNGFLVEVPRLPGHGPEVRDIADYRLEDWEAAVTSAAAGLRAEGIRRLVVAGHAVGASLALATAPATRPDGLVLLAPFWWPSPAWQRVLSPLVRVFLPAGFAVFSSTDTGDPQARGALEALLPGLDLDDPAVLASLHELRIPTPALEQLFRVSRAAGVAAPRVHAPVLAVQGLGDTISRPARTRALLARLPAPARYRELDTGHDLASETSLVRDEVLREVLAFALEAVRPDEGATARPTTDLAPG
jgi:carboxylesterase